MLISAIVAYAENFVIGKDNQIPWHLPGDLKYFKRVTLGHCVIMGRKCFESVGHPLPKRTNIVVTRNPDYFASGCVIKHSIEDGLEEARERGEEEAFILGGAEIYAQSMPKVDKLYITVVHASVPGDTYFPEPDWDNWVLVSKERHEADEKNPYPYTFTVYERKT